MYNVYIVCIISTGYTVPSSGWPAQKLPPLKKHFLSLTFSLFHGNSRHCIPEVHVGCSLNKGSVLERAQLMMVLDSSQLSTVTGIFFLFFSPSSSFAIFFFVLSISLWPPHRQTHLLSLSLRCADKNTYLWYNKRKRSNPPPLPQSPDCSLVQWAPRVHMVPTHTTPKASALIGNCRILDP